MKRKNESGAVVVEAAIVVTVVTMFIAVMLYIGMVLYQQSLVNIMANQTASNIAQIYGNTLRDPFTGYIDADGVHETVTYTNLRNQAYMNVIQQKADSAALYRLKSSKILTTGNTEVEVNVVPKNNELLKDQIVVTVTDTYEIPLISFFGAGNNRLTFSGTGRADCTDLLEYLTGVPAMGTNDGNAVIFSSDECTVNFYKHYGDSRPIKTMTVLRGNSVNSSTDYSHSVMPKNPTQEKMRFTKWIKADGHIFTGDSIVNEDTLNVYGNWECTVTFDPDGGRLVDLDPPTMTATVTGNIDLPVSERENCTFAGWYTKKNGEGERFTGINVQGDITVYAKWVCTVSFNPDGGSVSPDSIDIVYGKSFKNIGFTLPTPTRTNCMFDGWFDALYGDGKKYSNNDTIKGHKTLNAKWNCIVRFKNSANEEIFPEQVVVAGKNTKLPIPTRSNDGDKGWQFKGWKDSSGSIYDNNSIISKDVDLFEQWDCSHVHVYDRTIREATCDQDGLCIMKCKYCGNEIEKNLKNFGGHTEGEGVVTNPGCESKKVVKYYCTKCSSYLREETGSKLGHDYSGHCGQKHPVGTTWPLDDNHQTEGHYVEWASCTVCKRCGKRGSYRVLCGTHYTKWKKSGWPYWTYKECRDCGNLPNELEF